MSILQQSRAVTKVCGLAIIFGTSSVDCGGKTGDAAAPTYGAVGAGGVSSHSGRGGSGATADVASAAVGASTSAGVGANLTTIPYIDPSVVVACPGIPMEPMPNMAACAGTVMRIERFAAASVGCAYPIELPSSDWVLQPDELAVQYAAISGVELEIPRVSNAATCAKSVHGGWYFDDPFNPTDIELCPCSCALMGQQPVTVSFGCRPVLITH